MKTAMLAALLLALVPAAAPVSFEADSVRVGGEVISDVVLQLKDTPAGHILVSSGAVEPLVKPVPVLLAPDRILTVEPGVRVSRVKEGFALSLHNRRRLELLSGDETIALVVPVTLEVTPKGWKIAGREFGPEGLTVRRPKQDEDVDKNLQQLQDSTKKIQGSLNGGSKPLSQGAPATPPSQANRRSLLGGGGTGGTGSGSGLRYPVAPIFRDLTVGDAGFNAISPLFHASPIGF